MDNLVLNNTLAAFCAALFLFNRFAQFCSGSSVKTQLPVLRHELAARASAVLEHILLFLKYNRKIFRVKYNKVDEIKRPVKYISDLNRRAANGLEAKLKP